MKPLGRSVKLGHFWPVRPRMAMGRCHHGLCQSLHRPDEDTGDVHCREVGKRDWRDRRGRGEGAAYVGQDVVALSGVEEGERRPPTAE